MHTIMKTSWFLLALFLSCSAFAQSPVMMLPGNHPDPSIVATEKGYYLTHSTGMDNPGLPIWYSPDLRSWHIIGFAAAEPPGDVWAPDLQRVDGRWLLYFTALTAKGASNFVVQADRPEGPWSPPVELDLKGIDPGLIIGRDGRKFVYMSDGWMAELDASGTRVIRQQEKKYEGWPIPKSWNIECFCLEGPKLLRTPQWYYLLAAQGGTAGPSTSHMVVVARSASPDGPWENAPNNPVIHTASREENFWSKGHGTLFKGLDGQWWMIYHAYEKGYQGLGRGVMLSAMEFNAQGWPVESKRPVPKPVPPQAWEDDFNGPQLRNDWAVWKEPVAGKLRFSGGALLLEPSANPVFITPGDRAYEIESLVYPSDSVTAGINLFYNNNFQLGIAVSSKGVWQMIGGKLHLVAPVSLSSPVTLRIRNYHQEISYHYRSGTGEWQKLDLGHEVSGYQHNTLGGFRSLRAGIFAQGSAPGKFEKFSYRPIP